MLKYFNILLFVVAMLILFADLFFCQTPKATFLKEAEVDQQYVIWYAYEIDSLWLNVNLPDGDLPRRQNGTYLYWKADTNGKLIPIRKIDYRLPIFSDTPVVAKKEKTLFEQ